MNTARRSGARAGWRSLRGVRARLVATFVLAATVTAVAGVIVFVLVLGRALRTNVDQNLVTTAAAYANDVQTGALADHDAAITARTPATDRVHPRPVTSISAVVDPAGVVAEIEPLRIPAQLRDALTSRAATSRWTVTVGGRQYRILRERVPGPGGTWTVTVGQTLADVTDAAGDARNVLEAIVPVAVVLAGIGAWLLSGAALRPVDRMRADAQQLADTGSPGAITVPDGGDSLTRLAQTFNALLLRLHTSLDRQRTLVADAGHELRTPLAVLKTELQTAVRPGRTRADLEDSVMHAEREAARLAALADDLLLLAQADGRERVVRPQPCDVTDLVELAADAHAARFRAAGIDLTVYRPEHSIEAEVDPFAIRRVLDNLLANAANFTPPGGAVDLHVAVADRSGRRCVVISVDDTGFGFPDDFLPRAFERFARADQSRSRSGAAAGSGLGLALVAALVHAHGGTASAGNRDPAGAHLEIVVPVVASDRSTP